LQNYLNNTTWGRQANIFFTVTRGTDFPANFDLNRNGELKDGKTAFDEADAISRVANTPNALNLYYVGMKIEPIPEGRNLAFADKTVRNGWFGKDGLTTNTAAHEIGHLLGRDFHSPVGEIYKPDLMYPTELPTINQCRIRKPDWSYITQQP